jgi:hypothetical protein
VQLYFSTTGYLDTCQGACQCQHEGLSLVCGKDNIVYYSPCHAGCSSQSGPVRQISILIFVTIVGFVLTCYQITCLHMFSSVLSFLQRFPCKNDVAYGKRLKIPKSSSEAVNRRRPDNAMTKQKRTIGVVWSTRYNWKHRMDCSRPSDKTRR